ncbi:hypothetical protein AA0Y32_16095 [Georgenia phoenicis]|uniref:hypothetical protein n=1 Tax=unclassified Georgenia TaxID=2626815 RepID=UPI0039AEC764
MPLPLAGAGVRPVEADSLTPPEVVVDTVVRAATASRLRTRYAVGSGARATILARRLLPDRAYDALLARVVGVARR